MSDPRSDDPRVDLDDHVSHYLCIGCPLGCRLEVEEEAGEIIEIRGQSCKKGEVFARQEHTDPRRVVTTTVAVAGGLWPRLPVKTEGDVPKAAIIDGGRMLLATVVAVRGRPFRPGQEETLNFIGIAAVLFLIVLITVQELGGLLFG